VRGVGPGLAGNVWLRLERNFNVDDATHRDNHIARLSPQGEVDFLPVSLAQAAGQSLSFLEEPGAAAGSILWTGGTEANLLRVAVPGGMVSPATFHATIRRVSQPGGERLSLATASPARLSYASRALNFTFATDRLEHDGTQFQVRLDDQRNWSEPLSSPAFPLTGTSAGRHVLAVRARDRDGRLSEPAEFAFVVLAPWWQTWWAVGSYVILFVVVIVGFVKWRLRAVRRRNDELESLIATRTRELEVAKLGAEAASQAKSAFLANMSHELRTPLNAILGYAQILRKDTGLTPKGQRQLEIVGRNGEHLLQMINEVLDLAKIEAGKMTLHAVEFPLTRVVKSAADLLEQRAADKGLGFRLELGANLPRLVSSDEQKLRQVLLNLLGNAVKFTAHGEIVLAATRLNGHVRFEVRDTGPGIAAHQLAAIFQPFHQAVPASAAAQGTGLGLAISQRIVALLSGKIEVASVVGRGSRFWFDLPLPEVRATAPRNPAIRTVTGYRGPRRRILVTDDEPTNRAVLRDLLEPLGFVVEEAVDGAACLAAVSVRAPDALLLDLRMPVLGGLEVVPRLRAMSALSSLPIIAVSASVLGFHQDDAIAAGCDGFVAKPVQEAQLLDALGRVLRLEWIYRETTPAPGESATAFPETAGAPTRAEITAMIEFARDGDLAALRDWIAQALARGTAAAAFLGQVDELAAGFKMAEIRQCLDSAAAQLDQNSP
jgi:signal transduction histidine kinase/DNA-binding NarL/FixJ family response regulator